MLSIQKPEQKNRGWVLYFDKERIHGLFYFDRKIAWEQYNRAKSLAASGWELNDFIMEWF
jgi:hypothetical protein